MSEAAPTTRDEFLPAKIEVKLFGETRWRRVQNPWTPAARITRIVGVRACAEHIALGRGAKVLRDDGSPYNPPSPYSIFSGAYELVTPLGQKWQCEVRHGRENHKGHLTVYFLRHAYRRTRTWELRRVDLWKKRAPAGRIS